jgi:hypothetical protein
MELVEVSNEWTTGVEHVVTYDSWDQFVLCSENLDRIWRNVILLTWACRPEKSDYILQLVYLCKESPISIRLRANERQFEHRCVETKFKAHQAHLIASWLLNRNPDLWKVNELQRIAPISNNLKQAS